MHSVPLIVSGVENWPVYELPLLPLRNHQHSSEVLINCAGIIFGIIRHVFPGRKHCQHNLHYWSVLQRKNYHLLIVKPIFLNRDKSYEQI